MIEEINSCLLDVVHHDTFILNTHVLPFFIHFLTCIQFCVRNHSHSQKHLERGARC